MAQKQTTVRESLIGQFELARFDGWSSNAAFHQFANANQNKIVSKLRNATESQDREDVFAELEVAYRLLCAGSLQVQYEPAGKKSKGPDFRVEGMGELLANVEVKRMRLSDVSFATQLLTSNLIERLRTIEAVSYVFDLHFGGIPPGCDQEEPDKYGPFLRDLTENLATIVARCHAAVETAVRNGFFDRYVVEIPIGNARWTLELHNYRGPLPKPTNGYLGGPSAVPYKQNELEKITDDIVGKLRQLVPGEPNVLALICHSDTQEVVEFECAASSIIEAHKRNGISFFEKYLGSDAHAARDRVPDLSAIVVQPKWVPIGSTHGVFVIWQNPLATCPLGSDHPILTALGGRSK